MLDLEQLKDNWETARPHLTARGVSAAEADSFFIKDQVRRNAIHRLEGLQAQRNEASKEIGELKKSGKDSADSEARVRELKREIDIYQRSKDEADGELRRLLQTWPNLPHESVPSGQSADQNVEQKAWGTPRKFEFAAKPHWELGEALGILDMERAAKISGARFAVYWREGAQLERGLASFMLDQHTRHHGYTEVLPPMMVNERALFGTGQLPKFRDDLFNCIALDHEYDAALEAAKEYNKEDPDYSVNSLLNFVESAKSDHWLIPTAEVPLMNLYRDETLNETQLPISLAAGTSCFRAEAGSYGKDTRGIIRHHQFQKVELVKFAHPETSYDELEKLTRDAETILELLELPYRRMLLCAGDMGFSAAKTYDLEVWLPGQNAYREISSCSNTAAFQARRANIKFKPRSGGKSEFVHTLNGSALAVGRTWVAIVENYQQADGSVAIPKVLQPYMGGKTVIEATK